MRKFKLLEALKHSFNKPPVTGNRPTGYILLVDNIIYRHETHWKAANARLKKLRSNGIDALMLRADDRRLYKKN